MPPFDYSLKHASSGPDTSFSDGMGGSILGLCPTKSHSIQRALPWEATPNQNTSVLSGVACQYGALYKKDYVPRPYQPASIDLIFGILWLRVWRNTAGLSCCAGLVCQNTYNRGFESIESAGNTQIKREGPERKSKLEKTADLLEHSFCRLAKEIASDQATAKRFSNNFA